MYTSPPSCTLEKTFVFTQHPFLYTVQYTHTFVYTTLPILYSVHSYTLPTFLLTLHHTPILYTVQCTLIYTAYIFTYITPHTHPVHCTVYMPVKLGLKAQVFCDLFAQIRDFMEAALLSDRGCL